MTRYEMSITISFSVEAETGKRACWDMHEVLWQAKGFLPVPADMRIYATPPGQTEPEASMRINRGGGPRDSA